MLARKLIVPSSQASAFVRTITSTSICRRAPHLGDVTPDAANIFNTRQQEFREGLEIAKKKKEQAESQLQASFPHDDISRSNFPSTAVPDAWPVSNRDTHNNTSSHSVFEHTGEARQSEVESNSPKRGSGKLSSLIYGTDEGRQMDQEIERSFSQVLARGKYVHSIVMHDVKPDKVEEYVKLVGDWYPKVAANPENKVHLVGSWRTEVGECDTFVHIWEYQRYLGYHGSLHSISQHPDFPEFDRKLRTLITGKNSSLMQEFSFWPTTPPRKLGGVFELRSYQLHPGNLLEWETHWRKGLKARREVMEGVGAWFVQIGDLNTVHHLWQFANLEERKSRREQSWGVEGWADTVHKTVPLIQSMKSRVLIPMPWSPVS